MIGRGRSASSSTTATAAGGTWVSTTSVSDSGKRIKRRCLSSTPTLLLIAPLPPRATISSIGSPPSLVLLVYNSSSLSAFS
ncbi:hypothetical protein F3Y22_tig00112688pilonHSYRG00009 [Hibiscus syriacus]|uniref:Uncharacterized protein n=1 Tax=Hibiscus syriacus TaxID=106335 RepID=A0A6A2Y706_HIBSY|nr:hypothetical protein F3Y22_tig00112688pilonHSYRG00009 [Hibiscus syriacus]